MDSTQENPLLRFKAFWAALILMLLFALAGFAYRGLKTPGIELDAGAETIRLETLKVVREAEEKQVKDLGLTFHAPQGGHLVSVTVPAELADKAVAKLKASPGRKTEQLIPGSKTFLDQQSQTHDPTESEFLK